MPTCEHPDHGTGSEWHRDGGDLYTVLFTAKCGRYGTGTGTTAVVCAQWIATLRACHCACGAIHPAHEIVQVLGVVNDAA